MAEFKISRIRYTWRGSWNTTTAYNKDDVVRYGGSTWVCVRKHTASAFKSDQEFLANPGDTDFTPAWIKMTDGYEFVGNWNSSTIYKLGDVALYGGNLYVAIALHTSGSTFLENAEKWIEYTVSTNWTQEWTTSTRYGVGDVVRYSGIVYRCIAEHTSASSDALGIEIGNNDSEDDSTAELWEVLYENVEYKGDWTDSVKYRKNDLVRYGSGTILRCTVAHVSSNASRDLNHWALEFLGAGFAGDWSEVAYYAIGDLVRHGGFIYRSNTLNYNANPAQSIFNAGDGLLNDWSLLSKATNLRGTWSATENYKTGDVVRRGGYLYIALADTQLAQDGSSLNYLDTSNWEIVVPGDDWKNSWTSGQEYAIGDLVIYIGSTYRCNIQHIASNENFPGDNGNGFAYWDLVLQAGDNVGLSTRGDLLTYNLSRENVGDGSTFAPTNVPVGAQDSLVVVNDDNSVAYSRWGGVAKFRYVSPDGQDNVVDPLRGTDPFKPWKTIKYAAEQIDREDDTNNFIIKVATGEYREILPIILPNGTAVVGAELRSTTILPNVADTTVSTTAFLDALDRVSDIIQPVLAGQAVTRTTGNSVTQELTPSGLLPVSFDPPQFVDGIPGGTEIYDINVPTTIPPEIQNLITQSIAYLNFHINSTGVQPSVVGTNTAVTAQGYLNANTFMEANKEFIANEATAFAVFNNPSITDIDQEQFKEYIRSFIEAFQYDIIYTGNYKSIWAARKFRNLRLGSATEDMFYCRNATGVKDCTTKGLSGTLNPPISYELYQRPTGGSFISLDPGWGPADTRTWITTRSPYIQNVTTFGDNCTGQKIDGALHNGGNKSIVSNDFTQVISDGIGAWVLNNGRAELVSVFTYYAQIGMFAEKGGVIRATNGNSSYGSFGALADGNDPTETPRFAEVNNRTGQATIESAFAGEVNDEILVLEYRNAGENYSYADYTFVGSGVNAQVKQEEFRDNAVFEALVKNAPEDPGGTEGAGGYKLLGNNAQAGTTTTITLATNDSSDEAALLGLRIIITSGKGAGQYGYVTAYNPLTKVLNVSRESNDQPGWDHVISGTPSQPVLFTDNTYRFEPRPIFSQPGYSVTSVPLTSIQTNAAVAYGETYQTFSAIEGSAGTGETLGVTPAPATWNVTKVGRKYEVTLQDIGAGYEVGQQVTIKGSVLGGVDDEHDLIITVNAITDDSTNSIVNFSHVGIAQSGKFVITPSGSTSAFYSLDGTAWTTATLPASGNYKSIATGDYRFVAINNNPAVATNTLIYSRDGVNWETRNLSQSGIWNSVTFGILNDNGSGVFLAVAADADKGSYSTDGLTWSNTELPNIGDSTFNQWVDVAFGANKFVAVANSGNFVAVGEYDQGTDTWTWESHVMDVITDSSVKDWQSISYGNNRFVAISSTGDIAYSFNAIDWFGANMSTQDGSTAHFWKNITYGQGVFFAVGNTGSRDVAADPTTGPTTYCATSYDGVTWTDRNLLTSANWRAVGFGNPDITLGDSTTQSNSTPIFVAISEDSSNIINRIQTGARTLGRVIVEGGNIDHIRIWEPGSGYTSPPTLQLIDPNNTIDAYVEVRTGDAVLAQPSWINRGSGYRTSTTQVTLLGDGFADVIPNGQFVTVSGLEVLPGPGTQFRFRGDTVGFYTVTTSNTESVQSDGTITGLFRISPSLTLDDFLEHTSQVEIRERYSQVRITGHDFLDVGTGNFVETNYPTLYVTGQVYEALPANEVVELQGGRVFYTSTDQDGNFRTGELFAVEQATGIVTISADFFDLKGLTELALGGVRLGGSGTVVREFSTDTAFTADSNNVVPTQRAIKAYLQNRLNVGGSDLLTASFIAGTVRVGPNLINSTAGLEVIIPVLAEFKGAEISGSMLAQTMFHRSFADD